MAPRVIDLGRMRYRDAYALQREWLERVLRERDEVPEAERSPGVILLVEHDPPVITLTPRARVNLIASPDVLAREGIEVEETDRGGDITYHGPGQLVVYPILDLNLLKIRLHEYMRLLEAAVIDTCAAFGVAARRDACATGVWAPQGEAGGAGGEARGERREAVVGDGDSVGGGDGGLACSGAVNTDAKICAMGVRVRRWVSMHGLALNVTTDLRHFSYIVPCGLAGRPVTSLARELGERCPGMSTVKETLVAALIRAIDHGRAG